MNKKLQSYCLIGGSILALIGFFAYPLVAASVYYFSNQPVANPQPSGFQIANTPGEQVYWALGACPGIMLLIGLLRWGNISGPVKTVQTFLHLGGAASVLWTIFQEVTNGSLEDAYKKYYQQQYLFRPEHVPTTFGSGFWLLVIGLAIAAIGLYLPTKESETSKNISRAA